MMDGISAIEAELLDRAEIIKAARDPSEETILRRLFLQEARAILKWRQLVADLKFHELLVPKEHEATFREGAIAIEQLIALYDETLKASRGKHLRSLPAPTNIKRTRSTKKAPPK